jgi:integrase
VLGGRRPCVVPARNALRVRQASERLALGSAYADAEYVVVDEQGKPPRPEWYSDRFRALCRETRVPTIRLHATRHTLADVLLNAGMPAVDVAAWLGHTTEVMHERYGRSAQGGVREVGTTLGAIYAAAVK